MEPWQQKQAETKPAEKIVHRRVDGQLVAPKSLGKLNLFITLRGGGGVGKVLEWGLDGVLKKSIENHFIFLI
jgi:hypothetical protein